MYNYLALGHVRFWIDNATAVTLCNKLMSTNQFSQEINRILGAAEAECGIRVSAEHLSGSSIFLADLGSRAWSDPQLTRWKELTTTWIHYSSPCGKPTMEAGLPSTMIPGRYIAASIRLNMGTVDVVQQPNRTFSMVASARPSLQLIFFAIERWSTNFLEYSSQICRRHSLPNQPC
ncbi:LOW QUALITY PROTEIN: hypothetical protein PHMEG_00016711 [Phytophthora megakarya]|uniref:Uncharacterized protein n=1 Tax=Phytophthora megakarya TaxID=4795 RepID=A0A225VYB0_9STRA|nr:LOW QUALITY PROTEIN: hypothetical protein PHMEG_00016711 [Phytophthora megakarya]